MPFADTYWTQIFNFVTTPPPGIPPGTPATPTNITGASFSMWFRQFVVSPSAPLAQLSTTNGVVSGSIAGNILSVTSMFSGSLAVGQTLSGSASGTAVAQDTLILSQLSGSIGGTGVYLVSGSQVILSSVITAMGGLSIVSGTGGQLQATLTKAQLSTFPLGQVWFDIMRTDQVNPVSGIAEPQRYGGGYVLILEPVTQL